MDAHVHREMEQLLADETTFLTKLQKKLDHDVGARDGVSRTPPHPREFQIEETRREN